MKKISFSLDSLEPYFEKIKKLSRNQKIMICVLTVLIPVGLMVYFSYLPKYKAIEQLENEIKDLEQKLAEAKAKAKDLEKLRKDRDEAQLEFNVAKKALPESEEIPSLLTSISYSGQDSHLEFLLFQPEQQKTKGFYAEIPVSINVKGGYQNVLLFFDKVSRLPRIVNIKNIQMTPYKEKGKEEELNTKCNAITYKFLETSS